MAIYAQHFQDYALLAARVICIVIFTFYNRRAGFS